MHKRLAYTFHITTENLNLSYMTTESFMFDKYEQSFKIDFVELQYVKLTFIYFIKTYKIITNIQTRSNFAYDHSLS